MKTEEFIQELKKINIVLNEDQLIKLDEFYELLIIWNKKINLTSITKKEDVYLKHFYDSLTLIKAIDLTKSLKVLDVGTGAGFPGVVLKIVFPNLKITLLDSLNKRIIYLNEIIKKLDLQDIETVCSRCEDYSRINREKYDLVVARAVSHLGILLEIIIPTVKVDGYFIAMKSNVFDELDRSQNILKKLNCFVTNVLKFNLPYENSIRTLVTVKKKNITSNKYPRRYSLIKKDYL